VTRNPCVGSLEDPALLEAYKLSSRAAHVGWTGQDRRVLAKSRKADEKKPAKQN